MKTKTEDPLLNEYDEYYLAKPYKWDDIYRDAFIVDTLKGYLKEPPKNVLDIGCGNGHTLEAISKAWPDAECWGLDFSTEAIRLAKIRLPKGKFICASLDDNFLLSYDVVICGGVLEHMPDIDAALSEIKRHMDGILYLEVPNCLAYSTDKTEGFRRLDVGSHQTEWHLPRKKWAQHLRGFEIKKSIVGPRADYEFVWLLKLKNKGE